MMLGYNPESDLFAFDRETLKKHLVSIIMTAVLMVKVGAKMDEEFINDVADMSIDTIKYIEQKEGTYYEDKGDKM